VELFKEGERVIVVNSKSGYKGEATIVCHLFGSKYLVKIEVDGKEKCISVNVKDLRKVNKNAKKV
jgi:ribosomal protein L21E